ncbi:hypothetical protein M2138_001701 [Dysgonomonadaceae bacterium PH5-43]|nr:hypothetical protein [Dysgonomonadaceae bacterium PH5-43]
MNKQVNKEEITKKAKAFFHGETWKNFLVFFVFVILASGFWVMQYLQQEIEREIAIPINYVNTPKEIILKDSLPQEIIIKISDKGTAFIKYLVNKNSMSINADLANLPITDTLYNISRSSVNAAIVDNLSSFTRLLSFRPEVISVKYSPLTKKEIPVRINGKITPASGYVFVDSIAVAPCKVWAYGDKKDLDTIAYINTKKILQENVRKDLDFNVDLLSPSRINLSENRINIKAKVEEYTEKTFQLAVKVYNLPDDVSVRFFPSTVEVNCQIALSLYSQLTEEDLEISVDYKDIANSLNPNLIVSLTKKPNWLISYRLLPETIEFLIEKNNLQKAL